MKQSQTNSITRGNPKNAQMASTPGGQATNNRNNKCTYLYPTNSGNAIGIQQAIKSKIRYNSDPSGLVINLSKHSFSSETFQIKNKQKWTRLDTYRNVSTFIDLVQNDLNKEKKWKIQNPKPNLSKVEQKAMEELAKRKDIIITNADKGSAVVTMDVEKYINEANRQLSNKRNYKKL